MRRFIDADELIEFFDGYPDHVEFDVEDIKSIINEQDTADVRENVRGKWIHRKKWDKYVCSKCSFEQDTVSKFCPNCGADMRGGQDE